ncbi:MAG: hypothetical protein ABI566_13630, partial [Pseudolysinimonas sp.]
QDPKINIAGIRRGELIPDLGMISPARLSRQLRRLLDLGVIKRVTGTYRYYLLVTAGDHWVHDFRSLNVDGATDLGSFAIILQPGVPVTGTVRDAVTPATTLPGVSVAALGTTGDFLQWLSWDIDAGDAPITGSDGLFSIVVPLGETFELTSVDLTGSHLPQSWNHQLSFCGCGYDPITISPGGVASPVGPYAFDLIDVGDALDVSVYAMQWDGSDYENVDVVLEKLVSGVWAFVAHGVTDSSGLVDLIAGGDGDYRLRYNVGGAAAVVTLALDTCGCGPPAAYALADSGRQTLLPGLFATDLIYVDLTFAKPAAPVSGGSSTPPARRALTFTGAAVAPTATPTPTPAPTSTPAPSPSQTSEPAPSPTPTVDPAPTQNAFDLWWLWFLLLLIVALIIFFIVRGIVRR